MNDIAKMEQILRDEAARQKSLEKQAKTIISTKNKTFSIGDMRLGDTMNVVVVASAYENAYYDRPYDKTTVSPPACFAISESDEEMKPSASSPLKQSEICKDCKQNEWGSGSGRGKACRNGRRLIVLPFDDRGVQFDIVGVLNLAPTSLTNWSRYVSAITTTKVLPTWAIATTVSFDPKETYAKLQFKYCENVSPEQYTTIFSKMHEFKALALEEIDVSSYEPLVKSSKMA